MTSLTRNTLAAWTGLITGSGHLLSLIEGQLKDADLPQLGWYDVLWEVEKSSPSGLRPFELQSRLLLTQYNISRLLDRMAAAGLIRLAPSPDDGRGKIVFLTAEGRDMRCRMWPVYAQALQTGLHDRLSADEITSLAQITRKLRAEDHPHFE
jgi:DNA-binding MarR family transcriptional regulator